MPASFIGSQPESIGDPEKISVRHIHGEVFCLSRVPETAPVISEDGMSGFNADHLAFCEIKIEKQFQVVVADADKIIFKSPVTAGDGTE